MEQNILLLAEKSEGEIASGLIPAIEFNAPLAEANLRISNNLALLASTISMRAASVARRAGAMPRQEVARSLNEITARVVTVGHLHRLLATRPGGAGAEFGPHLRELCRLFISTLAAPGQVELVETGALECTVAADELLPLSLIVTEVVTNALRHAHPAHAPGLLIVGCQSHPDGSTVVEVADDGVGFPEGFAPATDGGVGLRTIDVLAQQIGAETTFDSRPTGLRFALRLRPTGGR